MLRPLLIALQFLTRLPLPKGILKESDYRPELLGRSVLFYPVAGLLIGGLLWLLVYALTEFFPALSSMLSAALVLLCWVLFTGALHLDGLSDSADAWVGGYGDREKTLAIMKDPYSGPAGVSIIVIVLILKFAVLTVVVETSRHALWLSPLLARTVVLPLFLTTPYARKQGIAAMQFEHLPRRWAWFVTVLIAAVCVGLFREKMLWLLLICVLMFVFLRYMMMQRLGGTTGDTTGAMIEIMEVTVLLVLAL